MKGAVLAIAVFAVSWASILIRLCEAPPLVISFYRLGIAAMVLLPLSARSRRRWLDRGTVLPTVASGLLLGLHFASWITSLRMTTIASSVVLATTTPVFAALFSRRFLGERAGRAAWAGIALSVAGAATIGWGDFRGGAPALVGDALALAGALFAAAYLTIGRSVRERAPLTGYLTIVYGVGAAAVGSAAVLNGDSLSGYAPRQYLLLATIAIVPNLIGHSLLNWAVRRMRIYVVNVAVLGEPVLATLYAAWLFREMPGLSWAAGAGMIGAGVLTVFVAERAGGGGEAEGGAPASAVEIEPAVSSLGGPPREGRP